MSCDTDFLPFARPDIGEAEVEAVVEALRSGWLTTGALTHRFESEFAAEVGCQHAIAVNSCTAALHLSLEALGIQRGDQVITTPYTFAATAEVIRYFDADPILVDVDPISCNIDPGRIAEAITPRTKAIIPVHIAGQACELKPIHEIADRHGLPVIEDAAHAFPATYGGQKIGSLSTTTCFSFYATKTMTTGEGGMICTNDAKIADRCRIMALHGISKDAWKRYTAAGSWKYEITEPGYKYNLTDMASAMGRVQLSRASAMRERRAEIAACYQAAFANEDWCSLPTALPDRMHAWHLYMLRLNPDRLSIDRDEFISRLRDRGIGVSVHFIPLHIHPYYAQRYGYKPESYPQAYQQYAREISLPIYSSMTPQEVSRVTNVVLDIGRQFHQQRNLTVAAAA
ncbi:DegT/DnrJ/EryC1/StrS family aminotransferase [Candidatus Laterigemmans baculatus]|uniref:DegT/DnrJ/EryC1/StrS family aminotransferase n=1 Tax=Candidatus Laterigemmans baculatus TaxID=2770505 RepID=UPI0013DA87A2|nr:DegT/DnrJ/EryC1/StrS family aminotransferase [Candidatus Laterigemmans baculatus]